MIELLDEAGLSNKYIRALIKAKGSEKLANLKTGDKLEVEINTGPEFKKSDHTEIKQCALYYSSNFFPFDFLYKGFSSPSSGECPKVEFFGHEHEFCEFLTLYKNLVSPGIKLSMIIYGIFHL